MIAINNGVPMWTDGGGNSVEGKRTSRPNLNSRISANPKNKPGNPVSDFSQDRIGQEGIRYDEKLFRTIEEKIGKKLFNLGSVLKILTSFSPVNSIFTCYEASVGRLYLGHPNEIVQVYHGNPDTAVITKYEGLRETFDHYIRFDKWLRMGEISTGKGRPNWYALDSEEGRRFGQVQLDSALFNREKTIAIVILDYPKRQDVINLEG